MTTARTATPRTARAINDRIALELFADRGPLTANQLKEATGLSRPSVADLIGRLARGGLVTVVGEAGEARRGPNARLYGLVADRAHVAALDVRLESVAIALADLTGRTVARTGLPVGPGSGRPGDRLVESVLDSLDRARRDARITEVHTAVIGAPGLVDPATGTLNRTTDALPAWHGELAEALRGRLGGRVLVENEVNLAGIAEHRTGAVQDRDTFVLLWLGTGTGAAVILDGTLRRGASGGAGEIGFLPVPGTGGAPSAVDCDRGLHSLTGSASVCELAAAHGLRPTAAGGAEEAEAVVGEARTGTTDRHRAFLAELADRVALAAAAVAAVLDPGCVVLGGEIGRAGGAELAGAVQDRLRQISPLRTEVRAGTVEGSPVLGGALLTALDTARAELFTQN
jgi:predicted NBD/HSP70 family sugar kinase